MSTADLDSILDEAQRALAAARSLQELIEVRARFLGKKGSVSSLLRGIASLGPEARAALGAEVNRAKQRIEALASERREALERAVQA
ncbi:MAG: phenylalanine--tRNA ligase subunit alpha, partial [Myxococcota bacterium]